MLTIDEIKNISFRKGTLMDGYKVEDVNAFLEEVIASFEQLKKEKTNLVHKIDVLATRVEQYRSDEETVRNALLASQKVADACIKEAKEKAAKIVREAETKAQTLLVEANKMTAAEKENFLQLQKDAVDLRAELIELYKKHIQAIDDLPTADDVEKSQSELDEKYPTEATDKEDPKTDNSILPDTSAELSDEAVNEALKVARNETAQSEKSVDTVTQTTERPVKKSSKFSHLKFGENYDVSAD